MNFLIPQLPMPPYPYRPPANFDRVSLAYRWVEYCIFGRVLETCRFSPIPALKTIEHALILGDGDGRFTARLLAANPTVFIEAIDTSRSMLRLLQRRTRSPRVHTYLADARIFDPPGKDFDCVVTHFFLDCLDQKDMDALALRIARNLRPGALWIISEFNSPETGIGRYSSRLIIRSLYFAFRILTGLRVHQIPSYSSSLSAAGFTRVRQHGFAGGLLTSEIWQFQPAIEIG